MSSPEDQELKEELGSLKPVLGCLKPVPIGIGPPLTSLGALVTETDLTLSARSWRAATMTARKTAARADSGTYGADVGA